MSKCTNIQKIDYILEVGDVLLVTIDDSMEALWFYDYADALAYVDQEVIVTYRADIYKGETRQFIATFARPTVINTLDKTDNIKLYLDQVDNNANVSFSEIEDGENRMGCIVFCTSCSYQSSSKASWMELIIRDRSMHTATLRLFSYENKEADFSGKYIKTSLSRNRYGFQTEFIKEMDGEVASNPELDVANTYITNYFQGDEVACNFLNKTGLIAGLSGLVDYEKGYGAVRLAMELAMIDSLKNITNDIDLQALGHVALCRRAHLLSNSILSAQWNDMRIANTFQWPNRRLVMQILDTNLSDDLKERDVYEQIQKTVSAILEVRKGCRFE